MKIIFHTNLDEASNDVHMLNRSIAPLTNLSISTDLSVIPIPVPRVGESVVFPFEKWDHDSGRGREYEFSLEVVQVRYNYSASTICS